MFYLSEEQTYLGNYVLHFYRCCCTAPWY